MILKLVIEIVVKKGNLAMRSRSGFTRMHVRKGHT